jgi:hypothetical protein
MLTLAAIRAFGPARTDAFGPLPAWRSTRRNHRASQEDIVSLLRHELDEARGGTRGTLARPELPHFARQTPQLPPPPQGIPAFQEELAPG